MSTEMIVDAAQRQLEAADETLVAWKPEDSDLATIATYSANAILMFQDRVAIMRRTVEQIHRLSRSGRVEPLQLWYEGSQLFKTALQPVSAHRETLARLRSGGYSVEGAETFEQMVRELEELRDHFRAAFPLASLEEEQAIRTAIARGESQDADETFAEIAGMDVASWRKRMKESRIGHQP